MTRPTGPKLSEPLILASSSPRRADLLRSYGYAFAVCVPPAEEPDQFDECLTPAQLAERLSHLKASAVKPLVRRGVILAADTVVTYQGRIFGKPIDQADARRILQTLSGTTHQVITGVTLMAAAGERRDTRHDVSTVSMMRLSPDELEDYLRSDAWVGKAGAYGVQDRADAYVTRVDGSFTNVVGLPLELLADMLHDWGE
jgi:septum formation protein